MGSLVAIKAKSLGKKNPTTLSSIREKNGQKNLIKVLKSSYNQSEAHRKTEKMNEDYEDEYYGDEFEKE